MPVYRISANYVQAVCLSETSKNTNNDSAAGKFEFHPSFGKRRRLMAEKLRKIARQCQGGGGGGTEMSESLEYATSGIIAFQLYCK